MTITNAAYSPAGRALPDNRLPIPDHFAINHHCCNLGFGIQCFESARDAILGLKQLSLGWLHVTGEVAPGHELTMHAYAFGIHWTLPLRVVGVFDQLDVDQRRAGFVYGTEQGHLLRGEERFCVYLDRSHRVGYEIFSYSRPAHLLTRLGWPLTRRLQKRFLLESERAIKRAIA